ncbi:P-loop containing nucleoside triphosphate hydrolase [Podospora conica]|nr:P-loop containing nucleoside triphosphate hydrolase [Schizothecium conicum]
MPNQNVYIVGAQCTGKTTLVNRLDQHFHGDPPPAGPPAIIKEVARTVLVKHNFTADDITSSQERCLLLQRLILEAQAKAEREVLQAGAAAWFISDRSGVDPIAYASQHVGEGAAEVLMGSSDWLELRERMQGSLIVVCEAGASWLTDDGVRLMPASMEEWKAFHELFCRMLGRMGLEFVVLPSTVVDLGDRVDFVLRKMEVNGVSS